jgi:hypothetical protein
VEDQKEMSGRAPNCKSGKGEQTRQTDSFLVSREKGAEFVLFPQGRAVEDSVGERRRGVVSEVLISRMNVGVEAKVRQAEDLYFSGYCPVEAEI